MSIRELLIFAAAAYFGGVTLILTIALATLALGDRMNREDGKPAAEGQGAGLSD